MIVRQSENPTESQHEALLEVSTLSGIQYVPSFLLSAYFDHTII